MNMNMKVSFKEAPQYLGERLKELEKDYLKLQVQVWGLFPDLDLILIRVGAVYLPEKRSPLFFIGESELVISEDQTRLPKPALLRALAEALEQVDRELLKVRKEELPPQFEDMASLLSGPIRALYRDADFLEEVENFEEEVGND